MQQFRRLQKAEHSRPMNSPRRVVRIRAGGHPPIRTQEKGPHMTSNDNIHDAETVQPIEPSAEEAHERELAEEDLLADMPALREPHRLRVRHRNRILRVALHASGLDIEAATSEDADPEAQIALLELLADVDEFAESIAVDKEAYAAWSESKSDKYDVFMAILNRYAVISGE